MQSIKFLDASQFRLCLLFGNGVGKPEYRALQRAPSALCCAKKDCCTWVLPGTAVLFLLSQFSKIVPIKTAYLRYAVCGCCLCIKNANCYKLLYLPVRRKLTRRATVSVENQRGSCRFPLCPSCEKAAQPSPQAWLSCKIKMQFLKPCAERSGAHLKSFCFGQKCSYSGFTCSSCSQ